ncbi:hypothetical protein N657DRAFT_102348 [Parathielavia appendiculata]|uniref:Uncharacterized protein n=1 Tax=Parathielavia appendiculata TaxID=2587402 RepID=A0AAN6TWG7_9PEZI|nr:hypothetical protein N657DRAFT_102348 [Parathielavia appendiculata]
MLHNPPILKTAQQAPSRASESPKPDNQGLYTPSTILLFYHPCLAAFPSECFLPTSSPPNRSPTNPHPVGRRRSSRKTPRKKPLNGAAYSRPSMRQPRPEAERKPSLITNSHSPRLADKGNSSVHQSLPARSVCRVVSPRLSSSLGRRRFGEPPGSIVHPVRS